MLDITSASATAHSIAMRISCDNIIDTPFPATFDDAHLSVVPRLFRVTVTGTVEWNQVTAPPLGAANEGDPVEMSFLVDANSYLDGIMFPTRGYVIPGLSHDDPRLRSHRPAEPVSGRDHALPS